MSCSLVVSLANTMLYLANRPGNVVTARLTTLAWASIPKINLPCALDRSGVDESGEKKRPERVGKLYKYNGIYFSLLGSAS
jgi:hypothetical protein